jgi:hypothetical protein
VSAAVAIAATEKNLHESRTASAYEVAVDHASLRGEVGPQGRRYHVALQGPVDDRWMRAYQIVQLDETGLLRFRLDPVNRVVSFSVRAGDGADYVGRLLGQLERLVEMTNRGAGLWTR